MSSKAFEVVLQVDPSGRCIVRLGGILLLLTGVALILQLPVDSGWRILLLVIWLGDCGINHWRLERGYRRVGAMRLDSAGALTVLAADGAGMPAGLLSGSLVCRRFAWLRLVLPDARRHAELVLAGHAGRHDWHRFQLIWRLCRETFGHQRRA